MPRAAISKCQRTFNRRLSALLGNFSQAGERGHEWRFFRRGVSYPYFRAPPKNLFTSFFGARGPVTFQSECPARLAGGSARRNGAAMDLRGVEAIQKGARDVAGADDADVLDDPRDVVLGND